MIETMKNNGEPDYIDFLVFQIEKIINAYDDAAKSRDVILTDSNAKSALSKVKKFLKGGTPGYPDSNEKEKMMAFMAKAVIKEIEISLHSEFENQDTGSLSEWNSALKRIENSMKYYKVPGGRDYLDFIDDFIHKIAEEAIEQRKEDQHSFLNSEIPRCGLCGATENLTKTECCDNWICDDESEYVPFSYERNSCFRNHMMRSLCAFHHSEQHKGDWKTCKTCKDKYKDYPEQYIFLATNEGNFEYIEDLPDVEKVRCSICSYPIDLNNDGYSMSGKNGYICRFCDDFEIPDFTGPLDEECELPAEPSDEIYCKFGEKEKAACIEKFNSHTEFLKTPFLLEKVVSKLWGDQNEIFQDKADDVIFEYLQECGDFVGIYNDKHQTDFYHYLPSYFEGKEFCVKPTEEEIREGILFPGHRFMPYISITIHPSEAELYDSDKLIGTKVVTKKLKDLMIYHSLLGDFGALDYFITDDIENVPDLDEPLHSDDKFKVTVMELGDFYKKHNFKYGDNILMKVDSFSNGKLTIRYRAQSELAEEKGKIVKWCGLFSDGIEKAITDIGIGISMDKELAMALILNADYLLNNPVIHIGGWLALSKQFSLKPLGNEAIIWYRDEDPEKLLEDDNFDDVDFDHIADIVDENMLTPPDRESMNDILKYMGFDIIKVEVEEYMKDELFKGGKNKEDVWNRCFDSRIDEFPEYKEYEKHLHKHFDKLWSAVSGSYNRFSDDKRGKIRIKALEIKDKQTAWMRNLESIVNDITDLKHQEFFELSKISGMISQVLIMLNECEDDISAKEVKMMRKTLDQVSKAIKKLQKDAELKIKKNK